MNEENLEENAEAVKLKKAAMEMINHANVFAADAYTAYPPPPEALLEDKKHLAALQLVYKAEPCDLKAMKKACDNYLRFVCKVKADLIDARCGNPPGVAHVSTMPEQEPYADWLWDGWIRMGVPSMLCAHGDGGKGILATTLALHVAAGMPYLGHDCKQGKILFTSAEDSNGEQASRTQDVAKNAELNEIAILDNIITISAVETGLSPCLIENGKPSPFLQLILKYCDEVKPVLIILDTLAAMAPDDADLVRSAVATKYIVGVTTAVQKIGSNAAILFTHHLKKPQGANP